MSTDVMVIGGGIAGIQASLDIADKGGHVILVEKTPSIGGRMAQLDKTFPTNDCSICILAPKMADCYSHPNIDVMTYSEVIGVEGDAGNFNVNVLKKARYVDETMCTGCEECVVKCPVKLPNEFDQGLGERKAIYMPFAQAVPRVVTIDKENCIWFIKEKCGACKILCKREAIDYDQKDEEVNINVGSIIVAIGYDLWDPTPASEYGYGKYPNVFTGMEYERMINASGPTGGEMQRRSDGKRPHKLAFIQCVGSRNPQLGHAYCCSVCCMFSTKEAMLAREHHEDIDSAIFYKDLRAFGKGFWEYVERAKKDYGVRYINSDATVQENPKNNNPIVVYDVAGRPEKEEFDMVVLATTLIPRSDAVKVAEMIGIPLTQFGFFESKDRILGPVDTKRDGVFLAGYCREPMDIPESVAEGSAAAARAVETVLEKGVSV
ncbi:MAG: CoB--CoM heterodisulfide reductase iron-sulfur subunit A family protein [Thermoplasmata archaeon]|nr:CoB--CoM heterodisulfide reductase iron-sulfur subunit A family protein [Thermoplasmata archaeon]